MKKLMCLRQYDGAVTGNTPRGYIRQRYQKHNYCDSLLNQLIETMDSVEEISGCLCSNRFNGEWRR